MSAHKPKDFSKKDWDTVECPPLTRAQFKKMRPAETAMPDLVASYRRSRDRPKVEHPKTLVSLRLYADVLRAFKAEGPGWQTRINAVLARWAKRRGTVA
jgi:uncharacterized protein (DUF4415 family)